MKALCLCKSSGSYYEWEFSKRWTLLQVGVLKAVDPTVSGSFKNQSCDKNIIAAFSLEIKRRKNGTKTTTAIQIRYEIHP